MDDTIKKFLKLRDKYEENGDIAECTLLRYIFVYFYENQNTLTKHNLFIPGKYDLVKVDRVLFELGYRRYSIDYLPKNSVFACRTTKITFRNTL